MKKFELVIDKAGVYLSSRDGQFVVKHDKNEQRIPPVKVRQIVLSKAVAISGGAVQLAVDNDIDVSFSGRDGMPFARVWNSKFGSIAKIRKNQLSFSDSPEGQRWIAQVITTKIKNQMALLTNIASNEVELRHDLERVRDKFSKYLLKLNLAEQHEQAVLANQLRGWEANASKMYFQMLSVLLPKEFKFLTRSKRPALDPFNACLNYGYGILYNKIEAFSMRSGLDPQIGIFHVDQYNRPVLVFDFIENFRHWVEYPVMQAFRDGLMRDFHFEQQGKGVLMNGAGKKVFIELLFSYWNEKVVWQGVRKRRLLHIQEYVQNFATQMKNYTPNEAKTSGI